MYKDKEKAKSYYREYYRKYYHKNKKKLYKYVRKDKKLFSYPPVYKNILEYRKSDIYKKSKKYKESKFKTYLKRKYRISPEEYSELLQQRNGVCDICKMLQKKLVIDHNHITGMVRGVLCHNCNKGIGFLKDNTTILNNAIKYLET